MQTSIFISISKINLINQPEVHNLKLLKLTLSSIESETL